MPKLKLSTELKGAGLSEAMAKLGPSLMEIFVRKKQSGEQEIMFSKMVKKRKEAKRVSKRQKCAQKLWMAQMAHKAIFELEDVIPEPESVQSSSVSVQSSKRSTRSGETSQSAPSNSAGTTGTATLFNADHPFLFMFAIDKPRIPIVIGRFYGR